MKKILSFALAASVAASSLFTPSAKAAERAPIEYYLPVDIENHFAVDQLNDFIDADIMKGMFNSQGFLEAKPKQQITRVQFVALMVRAMNLNSTKAAKDFKDVPKTHWAYNEVRVASSLGIVSGISDTRFAPNAVIYRDQMAKMIYNAFKSTVSFNGTPVKFSDVPSSYWASDAIAKTSGVGIIKGVGNTFKPKAMATRGEAAAILHRAMFKQTLSVPADATLTDVVMNNETEGYNAIKAKKYDSLDDITNKYQMGLQRAFTIMNNDDLMAEVEEGNTVDIELKGTLSVKVVKKTTNFAVVDLQGAVYEIKVGNKTVQDDVSGHVYLKKVNNTWKIFSSDYVYMWLM
ncbi:S-layer homology domain-containing protein [Fictibacillus aquaticus]|uniref:SLH domain-containing protein n=1 Tax=Fictibacillus aquaticus TaxID=2021314 RepID=A0A235F9J0_9BACL|nr:S-layer homology domain-containing protein [Fictibacillus aquaticus]OYD57744.1 hypothetical protein CGZ90_13880 [Fictibacillus aquaticus]